MNHAPRKFHRWFSPWISIPIFVTAAAGVTYRTGRAWFGMGKDTGETVLHIHTGAWLGSAGCSAYIVLTGLGLLALVLSGLYLVVTSRAKGNPRVLHRVLGAVLFLPLAATAVTGMMFHFGGKALPEETADLLMAIHQGSWLGKPLTPFYVLFLAGGLFVMMGTGLKLAGVFKKRAVRA